MDAEKERRAKMLRMAFRSALLQMVDALERYDEIRPRTAELRKENNKPTIAQENENAVGVNML